MRPFALILLLVGCSSGALAYPAPISVIENLDGVFKCEGPFALCAYGWVAQQLHNAHYAHSMRFWTLIGCYEFNGTNIGFSPSILRKDLKKSMTKTCSHNGKCLTTEVNTTGFCGAMNDGTMYPGYELVSTWNPNDWVTATNQTGDVPAGSAKPKMCTGGTATNCFAAACRRGSPKSTALPEGAPAYNATCYCPYFTTTKQPFLMGNGTNPCGPTDASELTNETLIYNGA
ncbi:hypothetical protein C2E21_0646 [Chlorella sorokiniana]|uniref:Uncharacterized protein n=1 Tax=Chlorella sorokiniana TaxID=3076 RepID=A0A2P6U417_CHLSO|nr:hypothetical protein C2E21_0646 [Chlorella sorokiniana]|eukprot:PRW61043.1 hypothetical protein C2E21_0646 [Chlorella sorokiniana]